VGGRGSEVLSLGRQVNASSLRTARRVQVTNTQGYARKDTSIWVKVRVAKEFPLQVTAICIPADKFTSSNPNMFNGVNTVFSFSKILPEKDARLPTVQDHAKLKTLTL
jgi:hypothetical protein